MSMLKIRNANKGDIETYFNWVNEDAVRKLSYNSKKISYLQHQEWFNKNLIDDNCFMYLFFINKEIGQVRIQKISKNNALISISVDKNFRGRGYGVQMLKKSIEIFHKAYPTIVINAYVKIENIASKNIFEKSGFKFMEELIYKNTNSFHYIYENKELRN